VYELYLSEKEAQEYYKLVLNSLCVTNLWRHQLLYLKRRYWQNISVKWWNLFNRKPEKYRNDLNRRTFFT